MVSYRDPEGSFVLLPSSRAERAGDRRLASCRELQDQGCSLQLFAVLIFIIASWFF